MTAAAGPSRSTAAAPSPTSSRARRTGGCIVRKLLSDNPEQYDDAAVAGHPGDPVPSMAAAPLAIGQDGHDRRHQRPAGAQGRAGRARHHRAASATRCGSATRRGPTSSPGGSCCPSRSTTDVDRGGRAGDGRRRGAAPARPRGRAAARSQAALRRRLSRDRDRADAWLALDRARGGAGAALAREIGFTQVSASHEVEPLIKLIGRGDTSVVDAYLSPVLRRYVDRVVAGLGGGAAPVLHAVQWRPDRRRRLPRQGRDPVRARPAASSAWRGPPTQAGFGQVIGFDMGGTSTDVSHFAGAYERTSETGGGRRAGARADARDPHRRGGRRLDLPF